jgi:hypothetical protein
MPFLVVPLGCGEALPDQLDVFLRRRYSLRRLLLEGVKDVNLAGELKVRFTASPRRGRGVA